MSPVDFRTSFETASSTHSVADKICLLFFSFHVYPTLSLSSSSPFKTPDSDFEGFDGEQRPPSSGGARSAADKELALLEHRLSGQVKGATMVRECVLSGWREGGLEGFVSLKAVNCLFSPHSGRRLSSVSSMDFSRTLSCLSLSEVLDTVIYLTYATALSKYSVSY